MELLATGTAESLIAAVGTNVQTTFASVDVVVYAVIGLFLTFWLIPQIVALFPRRSARRN